MSSKLEQWLHNELSSILDESLGTLPSWCLRGSLATTMQMNDTIMYHEAIKDLLDSLSDNELMEVYEAEYQLNGEWVAHGITGFKKDLEDYGYDLPDVLQERMAELLEEGAN